MNRIPSAMLLLTLTAVFVSAQTPVKSEPQKESPSLANDHEKNIRAYIELIRSDIRNDKTQIMGLVMKLDAEKAAKFWPIYKEFEAEYAQYGDGVLALIKNYAAHYDQMTPQTADQLAVRLLDLEQERNNMKRRYYQKFKTALDAITAARFLQVENQIERILDLQIAAELPVIDVPQKGQ